MTQSISNAYFFGTPVSIIDRAGRKWITAETAGRCLGYTETNLRHGVLKLYRHHADEFSSTDKGVTELATPGGKQSVIIFSDTGCIKLGFFANTPRAKEFRVWASRTLAGRETDTLRIAQLEEALLNQRPDWRNLLRYLDLGLSQNEIGLLLRVSACTVRRHLVELSACGLASYRADPELTERARHANRVRRDKERAAGRRPQLTLEVA